MTESSAAKDFHKITEAPGIGASREQLSALYTRYKFARTYCQGKDVLEVACGTGQGLGFLASSARRVVGGDINDDNLEIAQKKYTGRGNIEIRKMDAHTIDFPDQSFDVILLYEALYYLEEPQKFFLECYRLLKNKGILIISMVNREWADFNPSPYSTRYFSAQELADLMVKYDFQTDLYGVFPVIKNGLKDQIISGMKKAAVRLRVIPKSMKGKEFLKRIFFGQLAPLPDEVLEGMASFQSPTPLDLKEAYRYKFIFAVGKKRL